MEEYIHEELSREVYSISGYYLYTEEGLFPFKGREVLCLVGIGVVDNSCCGAGGCCFVRIPGYIISWKNTVDASGRPISQVEPITEQGEKQEIITLINSRYPHPQINF
ncbi:MAG: hypothetical protein U9N38_05430 [Thermodesulfobacteriota bacterium]|nr:hypothetical protein [Thermodesulfobacteriota bacterium]